jgi:hypothetical protein
VKIPFATILPRLASRLYVLYSVFVTSLAANLAAKICFYAAKADYALYVAIGPRIDTVGVWGSIPTRLPFSSVNPQIP